MLSNIREWVSSLYTTADVIDDEDRAWAKELADHADGSSVTEAILLNEEKYTASPLLDYLKENEQLAYILHGTEVVVEDEELGTYVENPTLRTLIIVSDQRVLILIGKRTSDGLWEIPMNAIRSIDVEHLSRHDYLVIDAQHDEERKTFFVNMVLQLDKDELNAALAYVESQRQTLVE